MIYWCEPDPMPMLLTSLSVTDTFNQMSFLSRRTTRPPFDVIVSSNYRCLPSAHRYYFCYYFVSPFTLSSKTTPLSILTAATAATMTATAAFARRGQCQQAHYRYVPQTYNVESDPLLFFFFFHRVFFLSSNSIALFTFQRFKTLLFYFCLLCFGIELLHWLTCARLCVFVRAHRPKHVSVIAEIDSYISIFRCCFQFFIAHLFIHVHSPLFAYTRIC